MVHTDMPQFFFAIIEGQADEFFGLRFEIIELHMIVSLLCHFQTPWKLEQAAYGAQTTDFVVFTPEDVSKDSPKRWQDYLAS